MFNKLFYVIQQLAFGTLAFILMVLPFVLIFSVIRTLFGSSTDSLVTIIITAISFAISVPVYSILEKSFMGRFVQFLVNHLDT